jgi:hypothetical protein
MTARTNDSAVARVVAWHNRHPLAQRITPAQVVGMGTVALPFVVAGAALPAAAQVEPSLTGALPSATLRERAAAAANSGAAGDSAPAQADAELPAPKPQRRAFSERFLAAPSLAGIERFARKHAVSHPQQAALLAAGPQREVPADAALRRGEPLALLYLGTAAIEDGQRRVRVLWGQMPQGAVVGQRLWSRNRIAALGVLSAVAVLMSTVLPQLAPGRGDMPQALIAASKPAASAPAAALAAPVQPVVVVPAAPPASAAVAVAAAPAAEEPEVVFAPPPPALEGDAWPVNIRPRIDPRTRHHAKHHSADLRSAPTAQPTQAASAPKPGAVYALVGRSTRSRAASEMLLGFMQTAAAAKAQSHQRTEVLPDAQGWRASWWPFANRQEAERARAHLASNGMRADIVEF